MASKSIRNDKWGQDTRSPGALGRIVCVSRFHPKMSIDDFKKFFNPEFEIDGITIQDHVAFVMFKRPIHAVEAIEFKNGKQDLYGKRVIIREGIKDRNKTMSNARHSHNSNSLQIACIDSARNDHRTSRSRSTSPHDAISPRRTTMAPIPAFQHQQLFPNSFGENIATFNQQQVQSDSQHKGTEQLRLEQQNLIYKRETQRRDQMILQLQRQVQEQQKSIIQMQQRQHVSIQRSKNKPPAYADLPENIKVYLSRVIENKTARELSVYQITDIILYFEHIKKLALIQQADEARQKAQEAEAAVERERERKRNEELPPDLKEALEMVSMLTKRD